MENRRRFLRVSFEEKFEVKTDSWSDHSATGLDISLNGCRFHCEQFLSEDENVKKLYCDPGNGGTSLVAKNVPLSLNNHQEIIRIVKDKKIDLTIVGPENPLAKGIVNVFSEERQPGASTEFS